MHISFSMKVLSGYMPSKYTPYLKSQHLFKVYRVLNLQPHLLLVKITFYCFIKALSLISNSSTFRKNNVITKITFYFLTFYLSSGYKGFMWFHLVLCVCVCVCVCVKWIEFKGHLALICNPSLSPPLFSNCSVSFHRNNYSQIIIAAINHITLLCAQSIFCTTYINLFNTLDYNG